MSDLKKPEWHRLFVAVPIPEPIKIAIATAQAELKLNILNTVVAWTRTEHLHITLKFLGNVAAARVKALIGRLGTACKVFSPLELRAENVGAFPNMRFPRVIWIGVSDTHRELIAMHEAVEMATKEFTNEKPEESFIPHATLARVKRLNARDQKLLAELLSRMNKRLFGEWTASEIELVRSELSSQGARHTCVARIHLTGHPKVIP